ncbi:MAG TPA: FAD-binding oxidoreductase [Alphaproteobacteria bacterium]|nr:FAD-binding oxidoreductase [Alphaproteobacteria bacterium]
MNWKEATLAGWGRSSTARTRLGRPERLAELDAAPRTADRNGLIARGAGRSYGDAALNDGGRTLLTTRLNRMVSFESMTGELVCEPGVTFGDLIETFAPRGFMPPASPGTAYATIGGAVANDVHGKNHDVHGSFGDHVRWIELILADGSTRRVGAADDPDLFAATIGGLGLTGLMRRIAFRLLPGASAAVEVRERRMSDLDAYLTAFAETRGKSTFSVGWIDALAKSGALGRGILETAEFAPAAGLVSKPRRRAAVPIDFPGFVLNPASVRLFNAVYFARVPAAGRTRIMPLAQFLYPLDAIADWNRIYGKRGFYQFQCVLPDAESPAGLRTMLEAIAAAGRGSFLAVLKTLGGEGRGHLSFPMRGHTLALDFPRASGAEELIGRLIRITRERGGRVYLAKDALLGAEDFRVMYPRLDEFERVLARVDPMGCFTSDLARRLKLKPAPMAGTA